MEQTNGYKTLDYAINKVKIDFEILGSNQDIRLRSMACDAFRDLNMAGVLPTVKSALVDIDANGVAQFPSDYEEYYKIGLEHCGRVINLVANDKISLTPRCGCSADEFQCRFNEFLSSDAPIWKDNVLAPVVDGGFGPGDFFNQMWDYIPYYHNGQFVAGFFGAGAGVYHGGYRINEAARNIQLDFNNARSAKLLIEYRSNGDIDTGNAYYPEYMAAAIIYFIKWHLCENSTQKVWTAKTDMFRYRYQRMVKRIVAHVCAMTVPEILYIVRSSFHQLPKR